MYHQAGRPFFELKLAGFKKLSILFDAFTIPPLPAPNPPRARQGLPDQYRTGQTARAKAGPTAPECCKTQWWG